MATKSAGAQTISKEKNGILRTKEKTLESGVFQKMMVDRLRPETRFILFLRRKTDARELESEIVLSYVPKIMACHKKLEEKTGQKQCLILPFIVDQIRMHHRMSFKMSVKQVYSSDLYRLQLDRWSSFYSAIFSNE